MLKRPPTPPKFFQDPDERLDYSFRHLWLDDGEDIAVSTWLADDSALILYDAQTVANVVTTWVRGGSVGKVYRVTNHVQTSEGRYVDRSFDLQIVQR